MLVVSKGVNLVMKCKENATERPYYIVNKRKIYVSYGSKPLVDCMKRTINKLVINN